MEKREKSRLIYADSVGCSDMLYASGVLVPDPFLYFEISDSRMLVVNPMELSRVRKNADKGLSVISTREAAGQCGLDTGKEIKATELIEAFSRIKGISKWSVPPDFPLALAHSLAGRLEFEPEKPFFPGREFKSRAEVRMIEDSVRLAERGLDKAVRILADAKIAKNGVLKTGKETVSSELIIGEVKAEIARNGGNAAFTIVSSGRDASDPHERGSGRIYAGIPIIIDIFPRNESTGYAGDLTRTFVKGRAPDIVRKAWNAVKDAQDTAFSCIRDGVAVSEVHGKVSATFRNCGFETETDCRRPFGFIHGTGHGLGLDIHEAPAIGRGSDTLKKGHVVTVEPGLYYPEWGGVRIEDVVLVRKNDCRNLTSAGKYLLIP